MGKKEEEEGTPEKGEEAEERELEGMLLATVYCEFFAFLSHCPRPTGGTHSGSAGVGFAKLCYKCIAEGLNVWNL